MKWNEVTNSTVTAILERVNDEVPAEHTSPEETIASLVRAINEINLAFTDIATNAPLETAQSVSDVALGQLNRTASFAAQIIHSRAKYAGQVMPADSATDEAAEAETKEVE